uniref:Integrin alpha-M-like n=1 Tax=Callorhinchus milii TaxID=7868 RepID=A0A4W3GWZ0_CALMI
GSPVVRRWQGREIDHSPAYTCVFQSKHLLETNAEVTYDTKRFIQSTTLFQKATVTTQLDILKQFNPLPIIVGSSVGGFVLLAIIAAILYKVGFFKREYKDLLNEGGETAGPAPDPTPGPTPGP